MPLLSHHHFGDGRYMLDETAQAATVFVQCLRRQCNDIALHLQALDLVNKRAFYTVARGSSDAVACILSYEIMRVLARPVTSLPPSVFSLYQHSAMDMTDTAMLVISQSGASDDLVASAVTAKARHSAVIAITNQADSPVERAASCTLPVNAGPELAVPATKTVIGSVAAGMALLGHIVPAYTAACEQAATVFECLNTADYATFINESALIAALSQAQNVYIIGRGAGLGAAQEIALKLKECCALHAEAYSASEVLHGPLQLVTKPLTVLLLDTGEAVAKPSLDTAAARFRQEGCEVYRVCPNAVDSSVLTPAAGAALLIYLLYPVVHAVAMAFGLNPDKPATLSKVTVTV